MNNGENQYDVSSHGSINYLQFTSLDLISIGNVKETNTFVATKNSGFFKCEQSIVRIERFAPSI